MTNKDPPKIELDQSAYKAERSGREPFFAVAIKILLAAFMFVIPVSAVAQEDYLGIEGAYFCSREFSAGAVYDEPSDAWIGTRFRANGGIVVSLDFTERGTRTNMGVEYPGSFYIFSVTKQGEGYQQECHNWFSDDPRHFLADRVTSAQVRCSGLSTYLINFTELRYLEYYMYGFTNGVDSNDDTPSVSGGVCTKIQ